jgi:hypothetical protein
LCSQPRGRNVVPSQGRTDIGALNHGPISCIAVNWVMYNYDMRTTITLDDETAELAAQYARGNRVSLSRAINELVQRGARPKSRIKYVDGWPVLDLPKRKHPLTTERVKQLEEESW